MILLAVSLTVAISILIALIETVYYSTTQSELATGPELHHCMSSKFALYATVLATGNGASTIAVYALGGALYPQFVANLEWWAPVIAAVLGVTGFNGVLANTNITFIEKSVLTFRKWTTRAQSLSIKAASDKHDDAYRLLQERMTQELEQIPEDKLNAYLTNYVGPGVVESLEADAARRNENPKLYKALELVNKAPKRAAAMLQVISEDTPKKLQ